MPKPFQAVGPDALIQTCEPFGFSPAVRVGDLLYVSGVLGVNEAGEMAETLEEQLDNIFNMIEAILAAEGATLKDVFSLTSYHVKPVAGDMAAQIKRHKNRFGSPLPAWTAVGTSSLVVPGGLVEISAIAKMP